MIKPVCFLILFLSCRICTAQLDLQCDQRDRHSVYIVSTDSSIIYRVDSVDTNPTGLIPVQAVPPSTIGISINANLDSAAGPTTMYYVNNLKNYYFWNGTGWSNTGHLSGSGFAAVNPGGTSNYIFNYGSGDVYRYDGTANGILLTSITGAVLADVATDSLGNFYLLHMTLQKIIAYTFSGIPIDTFNVTGSMGNFGGGFALLGNRFYTESLHELHEGIITGDTVNFSIIVSHPNILSNDIAVCPTSGFPVAVFQNPELPHLAMYPNPAHDMVDIKLDNTAKLKVYDCLNILRETIHVKGLTEYRLDVSQLKAGLYFINAESKNNTTASFKLVVQ